MKGRVVPVLPYAALLAGAAFLFERSTSFAALGRPGQLGPDFWPRAVLVLLMITCALEIARLLIAAPRVRDADAKSKREEEEAQMPRYPMLLGGGIALTILYVPGMQVVGFFIATVLYLAAFMWVGRYRRPGVIAVTSVVGSLAFVFVFMKVVYVSLPLGVGPFQWVSTRLMSLLGIH